MSHPAPEVWPGDHGQEGDGHRAYPQPGPPQPAMTSGKATASLVLAISSLVLCPVGYLLGLPAIVVGLLARRDVRRSSGRLAGDGWALGGIVIGAIGTLIGLVLTTVAVLVLVLGATLGNLVDSPLGTDDYDRTCDQLAQDQDPTNNCT